MHDKLFKIRQIASLVVFIIVLSFMGMVTGNRMMVLAYAGFFLVVSAMVFVSLRRKQRNYEVVYRDNTLLRKLLASVLGGFGIAAPLLVAKYSSLISLPLGMSEGMVDTYMLGLSVLFVVLLGASLYFINHKSGSLGLRLLGFALFFIMAVFPGLLMSTIDRSPMGIGSIYYVALVVLVLAYNAIMLFQVKE